MEFYDLKTRKKVNVPDSHIKKMKITSKNKTGSNTRYALVGEHEGRSLYKFVNEATFKASAAPEK